MELFTSTETLGYLANIARSTQALVEWQIDLRGHQEVHHSEAIRTAHNMLIGKFNVTDYVSQMKINPVHVHGTCEWFCRHPLFQNWLEGNSRLLLVSADPGCRKSTLVRYLIEDVIPQSHVQTAVSLPSS